MIQLERSMTHRWIIDKNVNSKDILADFAALISNAQEGFTMNDFVNDTIVQARDGQGSNITIGVRLLQLCYYMLGYSVNTERRDNAVTKIFMPSPMTMNILNANSDQEKAKNFLVNLFCIQYPHPFNRTPSSFEIYIGRLIVKLLLDDRIDRKLYIDECIWFLPFIEKLTLEVYESLISSILEYRTLSFEEKYNLFRSVDNYNYLFANVTHEINYYFLRLFHGFGVLKIYGDNQHNGGHLFRFRHGNPSAHATYRNDAYESHAHFSGYVKLNESVVEYAEMLNAEYSAYDTPTKMDSDGIMSQRDWLTNLYEIEPLNYLSCINTSIERRNEVSAIVATMIRASKYGSRDGREFENALEPFMNLFRETRDVEIISGAGNTDLLCTMEELQTEALYKMNVDAKTRGSALESINPVRLTNHIIRHGATFCIVVAPKFAAGVNNDIRNTKIVTVRSEDLGAYCYRECTESSDGYADFSSILRIINSNMGKDITRQIQMLTASRYGLSV